YRPWRQLVKSSCEFANRHFSSLASTNLCLNCQTQISYRITSEGAACGRMEASHVSFASRAWVHIWLPKTSMAAVDSCGLVGQDHEPRLLGTSDGLCRFGSR